MKLSELVGKEIINLVDGKRLGIINDTELIIDTKSGKIKSILIPERTGFYRKRKEFIIPWESVKKIGPEIIIVEVQENN